MDLRIYREDLELLGIVDTASSIIWTDRFRQCGDFEIYVAASPEMLDLLAEDRWVVCPESEMVCIIEKVQLVTNDESGDYLTVTGRCLRSLFDRRIVWEQTQLSGTVENGLRKLITDAFIAPKLSQRKCERMVLAAAHGYTDKLSAQYTGEVVLTAVEELCAANDYGFKVTAKPDLDIEVDFYKGSDRTAGQDVNPRVIFSEEFDNMTGSTRVRDKTAFKTVALVAGEGEGTARRKVVVGEGTANVDLRRREMFVDARDVSSNEGEVSVAEYEKQLAARGDTALAEACVVESTEGTVQHTTQYVYGVDYFLGDRVTTIDKYGIRSDVQVLEVVRVWDENGYSCTPTFG
jgi:hypothetical protein